MARILIIDDDEQARMMLRMTFEDAGYEIEEALDGETGLRLYREDPADLVITDLVMPGKEGVETIMELLRDFPEAKIIAISGGGKVSPNGYLRAARTLGAIRAFTKPLDREELVKAVNEIMAS